MRQTIPHLIGGLLRALNPFRWLAAGLRGLRNWRRLRVTGLDYITFSLPASLNDLPEQRGWLMRRLRGESAPSLYELDEIFGRIADDSRTRGVILYLGLLTLPLADLQTLRGSITRLRERGKKVICHAQLMTLGQYYLASAADEIIVQPGGDLMTVGLNERAVFLKDALDTVGVSLDVVAITPYKGAYDRLSRADISPEGREQLEWLLDARYEMLLDGIAEGRGTTRDAARAFIDHAPYVDTAALEAGHIDAVLNQEGLPAHLGGGQLVPWSRARHLLRLDAPKRHPKHVALLRVAGLMLPGESASPPTDIPVPFIGAERAGDVTVVRQVRSLMKSERTAAVILYIDSGGGAAVAAEAMTAALDELGRTRPLIVYMNNVAGSGGYYIATAGQWIVAQPGTITGSIGVVTAKPVTGALLDKIGANALEFTRGARAGLYSPTAPFTDEERAIVRNTVEHSYQQFVGRVARGRDMTPAAVDAVGGGRVWTGQQARTHGLVDELGDIHVALKVARQRANLPDDAPLVIVQGKGKPLPPQLADKADPAAALRYLWDNARGLANGAAQWVMPLWWG